MRLSLLAPIPGLLALGLLACGPDPTPTSSTARREGVQVVNYPLQFFAQRIAGDTQDVRFLAPPRVDPAFWMPGDDDIAALQSAKLILLNGASYAKWLDLVTIPRERTVVTSLSFEDQWLELPMTAMHSHGEGGAHGHAGIDFNTWLDPVLARKQAAAILAALVELDPAQADVLESNAAALDAELVSLDAALEQLSARASDVALLASHPVYGYLARRYGWDVHALLWEPDRMPDEEEWEQLGELAREHSARWMLYEDTPEPAIVERLRVEFGIETVVLRPCGNRPPDGDYLDEMRAGVERLRTIFLP